MKMMSNNFNKIPSPEFISRRSSSEIMMSNSAANIKEISYYEPSSQRSKPSNSRPQKLVSGSQFRAALRDPVQCENCSCYEKSLQKSKDTIRTLKVQIGRLEESLRDLTMTKSNNQKAQAQDTDILQLQIQLKELKKDKKQIQLNLENKEMENNQINQQLNNQKQLYSELQKIYDSTLISSQKKIGSLEQENKEYIDKYHLLYIEKEKLVVDNTTLEKTLLDLERRFNEAQIELLELRRNRDVVPVVDPELERLQNEVQSLTVTNTHHLRKIERLAVEVSQKDLLITSLQTSLQTSEVAKERAANAVNSLTKKLGEITQHFEESKRSHQNTLSLLQNSQSQITLLSETVNDQKTEIESLKAELSALQADKESQTRRLLELTHCMTLQSENTAKALEKALSSTIRLCVVAPTVNVHVSDKKLKFKANISDGMLRDFLMNQVLQKYTYVFEQMTENSAPNGAPLQYWVERVLGEMQRSIDNHITTAINEASTG